MKILSGFLVFFLCLTLSGCAEHAFKAAAQKDTLGAYKQYLSKYPDSQYSNQARQRMAELAFEGAQKEDTASAYEAFLKEFPESKNAEIALYKKAQKEDTVDAFDEFLKQYPKGELSLKANNRLRDLWFAKAQKENTIQTCEEFLKRYPEGELSLKVDKMLEQLCYEKALKEGTITSCEEFLKQYPQSPFSTEIKNKLANLQIPFCVTTTTKFSKFAIKFVAPEQTRGKGSNKARRQMPAGQKECKVDLSQSDVQGSIETAALVYGKEVRGVKIKVVGIKGVVIDGKEKYFLICRQGKLLRPLKRRPKLIYKGASIKNNPSRYNVEESDQMVILKADRESEMILFPLNLDKVHCKVNFDKDAIPLPAEHKILRPRF